MRYARTMRYPDGGGLPPQSGPAQYRPGLIAGFLAKTGLDLTLP